MGKSKRRRSGDRLSELPDSLIFDIFWVLPISDVVRTTKLSKRWRNLWKICPFINFSDYGFRECNLDKVRSLFNRALLLWEGAKLVKFRVKISRQLSISLVGDINVWVRFAKGKGVKELYLDLWYPCEIADNYHTDSELESLYSCSSLEVLSMEGCPVCIGNGNVKCDRLKSLTISSSVSMSLTPDMLSRVLGGSPNLEVFILKCFNPKFGEKWCIQSSSLKILSIAKVSSGSYYERGFEMKIQTPNLEALVILGSPFSTIFMDVAPLTDVTLGLDCLSPRCDWYITQEFLDIKGTLERILPSIQHVESLTLCHSCLEVLRVMNMKSLLSPLSELKFLKIETCLNDLETFSKHLQIAGLLQNFPKLKRLVIDDKFEDPNYDSDEDESEDDDDDPNEDENEDDDDYDDPDDEESQEFEENFPNSFLLELRTVKVSWAMCDELIFSFIETLLKYASKLEEMVFRLRGYKPTPPYVFLASKKKKKRSITKAAENAKIFSNCTVDLLQGLT